MTARQAHPHDPDPEPPRRRACRRAVLLVCSALWPLAPALAFEQQLAEPAMVVSVPRLPQVALGQGRVSADGRARTWAGRNGALEVDIQATAAPAAGSTRLCAGAFLRELVRRPGMPERDSIYRAPLDVDNFLVLYLLDDTGGRRLHAHLLAAVAGSHCVDAHFSRPVGEGEDVDEWRQRFGGAAIKAMAR